MNLMLDMAPGRTLPYLQYDMIFFLYYLIKGGAALFLVLRLGDPGKPNAKAIGLSSDSQAIFAVHVPASERLDNRRHLVCYILSLLFLLAPYMKWGLASLLLENLI